ncbi:MAG: MlaD family protein, partial [Desulfopila sp.]|nr:MlaD family protein [Desulfopila sp.]
MEPTPVLKKKRRISPIWTLPVIAFCISLWIVYTSYQEAGITVTVYFEDASGITQGKTQVIIRGIPIGTVSGIEPDLDNRRVKTLISMDKSAEKFLSEDARFWIVRPEISAASIQGLDTLLSGSYIGFQPGISSERTTNFVGLSSPPPIPEETPGLHINLRAEELGSIHNGSEVYYRNLTIGSITKHRLSKDSGSVIISLFIKPEYAHLVREGSRFCNASGVTLSGKLTNLQVRVESLASLMKGGIVLHTPKALENTPAAHNGMTFPLYKDLEAAQYGVEMTLQLASSRGITEGETKLIYRGLVAGIVKKIDFNDDEKHTVTAHIMLDPRAERILRQGTQFWLVSPEISLEKVENLDVLLSGSYITFIPGEGSFQDHFEILPAPPPQRPLR